MTTPTLDLHGSASALLHRPRLAAVGCVLLSLAGFVQILTALLPCVIRPTDLATWLSQSRLLALGTCIGAVLFAAAAVVLYVADLTHRATPPISPWPRRLLIVFTNLYSLCHCTAELRMFAFYRPSFAWRVYSEHSQRMKSFYLPLFLIALAASSASSASFALGLAYALQIAVFLHDKIFRVAATAMLSFTLLMITAQFFYTVNELANLHGTGLHLIQVPHFALLWTILQAFLAVSLTLFFLLVAYRLRLAAKLAAP